MKMRTCLVVILAVGLLVGAFTSYSYAVCSRIVKIVRVSTIDDGDVYVYGMDLYQVLPGYYYWWKIANDDLELINAAQAAATSGRIAQVEGDAATCPETNPDRDGGYVQKLWIYR